MNFIDQVAGAIGLGNVLNGSVSPASAANQQGNINQQAGLGQQNVFTPPTVAQQYSYVRKSIEARVKVMEYIEAQLNMDLFKGDTQATYQFEAAMQYALEKMKS